MAKTTNAWSFKGYSLKTWAFKNKESLKLIASGVFGIATAFISTLSPTWSLALGGIITAVSKLVLDSIDYFQSE